QGAHAQVGFIRRVSRLAAAGVAPHHRSLAPTARRLEAGLTGGGHDGAAHFLRDVPARRHRVVAAVYSRSGKRVVVELVEYRDLRTAVADGLGPTGARR